VEDITRVRFSPTPNNLLLIEKANSVELWDTAQEKPLWSAAGSPAAFSGDGQRVAVVVNQHITLFKADDGSIVKSSPDVQNISAIALNRDASLLLANYPAPTGTIHLVTPFYWKPQALDRGKLEFPGTPAAVVFSPDGSRAIVGDSRGNLQVWDTTSGQRVLSAIRGDGVSTSNQINAITFSPDGKQIVTAESNPQGIVRIYNAADLKLVDTFGVNTGDTSVYDLAYSSDGKRLAIATNTTVRILDTTTYDQMTTLILKP
jgi:WD40 repeat protein